MKESIFGIIGSVGAVLSLAIQSVKAIGTYKKEKSDRLTLKLCNQIAYYNGVYQIKIINTSPNATAFNLNGTVRLKNKHLNYFYRLPDFKIQENLYSRNKDNEKEACEVLINIDVMRMDGNIKDHESGEIKELYRTKKLELLNILSNEDMRLIIRYNAVNKSTGKTVYYDKHEFCYYDITAGKFGIGNDFVTRI